MAANYYKVVSPKMDYQKLSRTYPEEVFPFESYNEPLSFEKASILLKAIPGSILCQWRKGPRIGVKVIGETEEKLSRTWIES